MGDLMLKLAIISHLLGATVLSGIFVLVVLATPSLVEHAFRYIPIAFALGIVAAIPPSIWAAKKVLAQTKGV